MPLDPHIKTVVTDSINDLFFKLKLRLLGKYFTGPTLYFDLIDEVDPLAAEFDVEVEDAPWGREIELTDPDGNRLRIGSPLR